MMDEKFYQELKEEIQPYFGTSGGHEFDHTKRVLNLALEISKDEDVDLDIIKASALLHDVARLKQDNDECSCHAEEGAKMAKSILLKTNFPKDKIPKVCSAIKCHRFSKGIKAQSKEAQILQDADRLDALGAITIGRIFSYGGKNSRLMHDPNTSLQEYNHNTDSQTSINHFYEKIFHIKPETFNTQKSREIAKGRYKFVGEFVDRFIKDGKENYKMKIKTYSIDGKTGKEIELPKCFSENIREDIVAKVLEAKKSMQPYAPSPVAGKQHAAKGKVVHRRHVWRSGYGRGASRVPRKIFSRRGSQFNWEAAEIPFARGGMRAHPPKVLGHINTLKINKKEFRLAFLSALSATANEKWVTKKYSSIEKVKELPIVIEGKLSSLKIKELLSSLKKILGENLFNVAVKKKSIRAGRGKLRGRKYKSNAGMLLVIGRKENLKTNAFDVKTVKNLGIKDLAQGGLGRLTVYTEQAIKELEERLK